MRRAPSLSASFLVRARRFCIHSATERDNGVFRCTLDELGYSADARQIPAWMFDCAACMSDMFIEADPFVDLESARRIVRFARPGVEDRRAIIEMPGFRDAYGVSRDQRIGEKAMAAEDDPASAVRVRSKSCWRIPTRWICLQAHAWWSRLIGPTCRRARGALLGLMTRLILDHPQATADAAQGGGQP